MEQGVGRCSPHPPARRRWEECPDRESKSRLADGSHLAGWLILSARILVIALHSSSAAIYLFRRTTVVIPIFFHCDVVAWWTDLANGENEAGGTEQGGTYLDSRRSPAGAWATSNSVSGGECS